MVSLVFHTFCENIQQVDLQCAVWNYFCSVSFEILCPRDVVETKAIQRDISLCFINIQIELLCMYFQAIFVSAKSNKGIQIFLGKLAFNSENRYDFLDSCKIYCESTAALRALHHNNWNDERDFDRGFFRWNNFKRISIFYVVDCITKTRQASEFELNAWIETKDYRYDVNIDK